MKEVLVGLREDQERELKQLAKAQRASRAALIRRAIDDFLERRRTPPEVDEAFGLWGDKAGDGLSYQRAIRDEW